MRSRIVILLLVLVALVALVAFVQRTSTRSVSPETDNRSVLALPADPQNASYVVNGSDVWLSDGEATHDGASYRIVYGPVYGVLQSDEGKDAALVLERTHNGSGTLHLAAALWRDGGYLGTNAHEIPVTRDVHVGDDLITVSLPEGGDLFYTLTGAYLEPVRLPDGALLVRGELLAESEGFSFAVCNGRSSAVDPNSRTFAALSLLYREVLARRSIGMGPIYVVVVGRMLGEEGEERILIDRIIAAPTSGTCPLEADADPSVEAVGTSTSTTTAPFL